MKRLPGLATKLIHHQGKEGLACYDTPRINALLPRRMNGLPHRAKRWSLGSGQP